jgi:hypothetical protein
MIKGDAPLETRVSVACIIEDAQYECASPFCHRRGRVLNINLTEMRKKNILSPFYLPLSQFRSSMMQACLV